MTLIKALIVTHDTSVLQSLKQLLGNCRVDMCVANTYTMAQEHLREDNSFQLVIAEYELSGLSGISFLETVKSRLPEVARILLVSPSHVQEAIDSINSGLIYWYFSKPWDPQEVRYILQQAIRTHDHEVQFDFLLNVFQQ